MTQVCASCERSRHSWVLIFQRCASALGRAGAAICRHLSATCLPCRFAPGLVSSSILDETATLRACACERFAAPANMPAASPGRSGKRQAFLETTETGCCCAAMMPRCQHACCRSSRCFCSQQFKDRASLGCYALLQRSPSSLAAPVDASANLNPVILAPKPMSIHAVSCLYNHGSGGGIPLFIVSGQWCLLTTILVLLCSGPVGLHWQAPQAVFKSTS
jgi:hypothetical protein